MEIGGAFDEDLFGDTKDRDTRKPLTSYNAKFCEPEWFEEAVGSDPGEEAQLNKFRADWAFRKQSWTTALQAYTGSLELVPRNNLSMRRDIQESIVRCYLALKQYQDATTLAQHLFQESQNFEQLTNTVHLLIKVYRESGRLTDQILAIQRFLILHPLKPDIWLQLAECYSQLILLEAEHTATNQQNQTLCSQRSAKSKQNIRNCEQNADSNCVVPPSERSDVDIVDITSRLQLDDWHSVIPGVKNLPGKLVIATSLARANILQKAVVRDVSDFSRPRQAKILEKIKEGLESLELTQEELDKVSAFVVGDLRNDDEKSDASPSAEQAKLSQKPEEIVKQEDKAIQQCFVQRWFSWMC